MHATFPIHHILLFLLSYLVKSTNYAGDYTVFSNILHSVTDLDHLLSTPFTETLNFELIIFPCTHQATLHEFICAGTTFTWMCTWEWMSSTIYS